MSDQATASNGAAQRYYGKYRGIVVGNQDPQQIGRVQVQVADVLGATSSGWAMPSLASAGAQAGIFAVPPTGSQVWVEFEQGDPDYPILAGSFHGSQADVPPGANSPAPTPGGQNIVIQTTGQSSLVISDSPPTATSGGIVLQSGSSSIVINDTGIYISNGQATISLIGSTVAINDTALTIAGS